jgi:hypothetical protein
MRLPEVLGLPVKSFWMLHKAVDRMQAELDYRMVAVVAHGMSGGEGLENLVKDLRGQVGTVVEWEEGHAPAPVAATVTELDREGLDSLRGLGKI